MAQQFYNSFGTQVNNHVQGQQPYNPFASQTVINSRPPNDVPSFMQKEDPVQRVSISDVDDPSKFTLGMKSEYNTLSTGGNPFAPVERMPDFLVQK